jgi:formiminotetrahydrofolate cyclodeaminase
MTRLATPLDQLTVRELLTSIAAKTPTPGGGAVASLTAALASALAQMVISYSVGKKSLASNEALHQSAFRRFNDWSARSLALAEQDAAAYARLNTLLKLDPNDAARRREFRGAVDAAIAAPQAVLELALDMLALMKTLGGTTNPMLKSDLAIAAVLAEAAARSAAWNVRVNLPLMQDQSDREELGSILDRALKTAHEAKDQVEQVCG